MSGKSIFIQAIGLFGTVLFFLSYQCRNNRTLFRVQFVSYLCYTTHLLMLGAITGGISYVLNTVRSFCLGSRSRFLKGKIMCAALCVMQVAALIFTWDGWWSILLVPRTLRPRSAGIRTIRGKSVSLGCWSIRRCGLFTMESSAPGRGFWTRSSRKCP